MTNPLFKEEIDTVKPYKPGKPIKEVERELGLKNVIKLASNENPLGPSGKSVRAMKKAIRDIHLYPDGGCYYLTKKLSQMLEVSESQIIVGNGSNEIIELLARGFLSPGDEVLSSEQTFLVYPILSQVCGARYVTVPMKNHGYDLKALLQAVSDRTKIIFIANPNNPTGTYVTAKEVESFLKHIPEDILVCFDEAYLDFVEAKDFPNALQYVKRDLPNVLVLRTFSKAYGLAGLRVGYGIGHKKVIQYLHKIRQPFNVNSIAQAAALAALGDTFFRWRTKRLVASGRRYFYKQFKKMKLKYLPSQANFVLVDTGVDGDRVYEALLRKGVIVRSMKAYGFETWLRITIGKTKENKRFCRALEECLAVQ
ncbi:MAG: histidinol-phosphate transaminase [Candidatus Omnitrophica bacterium]|nr:histidinol-phosphate transaminase [Candidatus Omnitrophota bacterium]